MNFGHTMGLIFVEYLSKNTQYDDVEVLVREATKNSEEMVSICDWLNALVCYSVI